MTTLPDRLVDLASAAGPGAPDPDLWRRGRSHGRRRRLATVGSVLAVVLLAAVAAAGIAARPLHPVQPVAPDEQTGLPARFFVPSGRLPTAHGGTGPLVAVVPTDHFDWLQRDRPGLVGVSAVDQSYAFLDLPGWIGRGWTGDTWSLSANGRWVSYWYGEPAGDAPETVVAEGIAILDTTTGVARRFGFDTDLGVAPRPVGWTGDTLWFAEEDYTEIRDGSSSGHIAAAYTWGPGAAEPHRVADPGLLVSTPGGPAGTDGFLAEGDHSAWYAVHDAADLTGEPLAHIDAESVRPGMSALSPDSRTVAIVESPDTTSHDRLATVGVSERQVRRLDVELASDPVLLGWLDDDSVAVVAVHDDGLALLSVDVRTGGVRVLSTFEGDSLGGTRLAPDLLRSPVVSAQAPPQPPDPRRVGLLVGGGVLVLLRLGLALRRRRARR